MRGLRPMTQEERDFAEERHGLGLDFSGASVSRWMISMTLPSSATCPP